MAFCWLDSTVSTAPPPALAGLLEPSFELFELDPVLETPPHAASAAATTRAQQPALSVLYVLLRSIERAPPDTNVVSICGPPGLALGRRHRGSCAPGGGGGRWLVVGH